MKDGSKLGGESRDTYNTSPEETAATISDRIAKKGLHGVKKKTNKLERLVVEYVEITSIKPNTYNPNRQDAATLELLCRSMKEDGFTQPIIVHRQTRQIVDGEHRWRAAQKIGMTQIPIALVDMSDEQMKIATLRHNRARGSEDIELSADVVRDLQWLGEIGWAQDSLMMSDNELNDLFEDLSVAEQLAGEEYDDAWVPERGEARDDDTVDDATSRKLVEKSNDGHTGVNASASTAAAVQQAKERKEALQNATTANERATISKEFKQPYRLSTTFTSGEADIVRKVLGDEPGEVLLAICKEEVEKMDSQAAEE